MFWLVLSNSKACFIVTIGVKFGFRLGLGAMELIMPMKVLTKEEVDHCRPTELYSFFIYIYYIIKSHFTTF